jgi:hypothetical protein
MVSPVADLQVLPQIKREKKPPAGAAAVPTGAGTGAEQGRARRAGDREKMWGSCWGFHIRRLLGGYEHFEKIIHSVGNVINPTDELIFFKGVCIPPTRRF